MVATKNTLELEQRLSLAEWEFITFAELIIADRSRNTGGVNVLFGQSHRNPYLSGGVDELAHLGNGWTRLSLGLGQQNQEPIQCFRSTPRKKKIMTGRNLFY
jgi:hypothetical protein